MIGCREQGQGQWQGHKQIPEVDHWIQLTYFVYVRTPLMTGGATKNLYCWHAMPCHAISPPVARDVISNKTENVWGEGDMGYGYGL